MASNVCRHHHRLLVISTNTHRHSPLLCRALRCRTSLTAMAMVASQRTRPRTATLPSLKSAPISPNHLPKSGNAT